LPGLGQLGSLVAIGVGLAALVMVMIYLPPLFPGRRTPPAGDKPPAWWKYFVPPQVRSAGFQPASTPSGQGRPTLPVVLTGAVLLLACAVLCFHRPGLDRSGNALRPQRGEAEAALDEIKVEMMGLRSEPLWLIISGHQEREVYDRLTVARGPADQGRVKSLDLAAYLMPSVMWPRAELQAANRNTAAVLGRLGPTLARRPPWAKASTPMPWC